MLLLLPCLLVVGVARQLRSPPRHCLSLTISPPRALFVISLAHLFTQLFLLVIGVFLPRSRCCFSSHASFPLPPLLPGLPPLSVSPARALLVNRTRARSRNRAACQLDERGHAGPADLAMLSHRKAPPPPRLSFTRTYKVCSVKSHSPHTSHSIVQLWRQGIPRNCHKKTVPPYQTHV